MPMCLKCSFKLVLPDWALSNALFVAWVFSVWRYHCRGHVNRLYSKSCCWFFVYHGCTSYDYCLYIWFVTGNTFIRLKWYYYVCHWHTRIIYSRLYYSKSIFVVLESILFILLWVLSDNSSYISNYLSLSMIANEEKMKFKKFRKNTCIGYRFMLLWLSTKGYRSEQKNFKKVFKKFLTLSETDDKIHLVVMMLA